MSKYQIGGHSTVLQWCRKYGKLYYSKTTLPGRPMKDLQKQRIKDLEHELKQAREKILVYEKLIEVTKRETGIDVRKTSTPSCPRIGSPKKNNKHCRMLPTPWYK